METINNELLQSAKAGHQGKVKKLLKNNADVNYSGLNNWTALMEAANEGKAECVHVLINAGADIHRQASSGRTALHLSARNGHLNCIKILVAAGLNVNEQDAEGKTPLLLTMYGPAKNMKEIASFLLENNADINIISKENEKPIDKARARDLDDIVGMFESQQERISLHAMLDQSNEEDELPQFSM